MIDAGIHVCIAAGNNRYKADLPTGTDYNNSVTVSGSVRSYHQGSSPFDDEAFIVGNIDIDYTGNLENKAGSSCIDSRISDPTNYTDDSPGANDNASGMAGTIEAASIVLFGEIIEAFWVSITKLLQTPQKPCTRAE